MRLFGANAPPSPNAKTTVSPADRELLEQHGAKIHVGYIGSYEVDERIPTLLVTLAYARAVGIPMEVLVDDELDLPKKLPGKSKH